MALQPSTSSGSYQDVAASQTDKVLGTNGAIFDTLCSVTIRPVTTSPGAVSIKDGAGSVINIFSGGAASLTTLTSWTHYYGGVNGIQSTAGAWSITTGANVTAFATGTFTQ